MKNKSLFPLDRTDITLLKELSLYSKEDILYEEEKEIYPFLIKLVKQNRLNLLKQFIISKKFDINRGDDYGTNLFFYVLRSNWHVDVKFDLLLLLKKYKYDFNHRDVFSHNLVMDCARFPKQGKIFQELLEMVKNPEERIGLEKINFIDVAKKNRNFDYILLYQRFLNKKYFIENL